MKIVIIGDGKVGFTLTQALSKEGHDLVVIDSQRGALAQAADHLDVMVMEGNGASAALQREAGVPSADLLIAVTSADETNLLCCMVARKLGCKHTIARVRNSEYLEAQYLLRDELGLSMSVNPEKIAAREIFGLLKFPSFTKRETFAKGRAQIVAIPVHEGSKLDGMPLPQLYKALKIRVLICAVEREGEVIIPDGSFVLRAGDIMHVTAPAHDLITLIKVLELEKARIRSVMLVGGSRIAVHLAKLLCDAGIQVKIIEKNYEKCEQLGELLPYAIIAHADGTSFQTLLNEGLEGVGALVTLTNIDEQNLVISMYASHMGVPKVITKVNRLDYEDFMRDSDSESVISPRIQVSSDILRYVRSMENRKDDGSMLALHRMVGGEVEALEFRVTADTQHTDIPLIDVPVQKGILIAAISRRGQIIIPRGDDHFQEGDSVVVVTRSDRKLCDLNDIFEDAQED
ncbi:MAG: Trk system potassium transporter TrkA [Clostridia bacterium]|nr:Trk system potassium transporter TrkA [Clostridia bacterium]